MTRPIALEEHSPPPSRGLTLGLRLGLTLALIVTVVLGTLTTIQQRRETRREWRDREDLLQESLDPLAAEVEAASTLEEVRKQLLSFQRAYVWRGHPDHQVQLLDHSGRTLISSLPGRPDSSSKPLLRAWVEVSSPLLPEGRGALEVWQDGSTLAAESAGRWRLWWLMIAVTALTIIASAQAAVFFLVSRPVGQLVSSLRRMEMGYLGTLERPGGAWEVRWLAWRLERTAVELQETVRRLVSAERRALAQSGRTGADNGRVVHDGAVPEAPTPRSADKSRRDLLTRQYLADMARLLESLTADDPAARPLAQEAWEVSAGEAARVGAMDVRARLEDAALRVLDPDAFARLTRRLQAVNAARRGWLTRCQETLEQALAERDVHWLGIQHRVKHIAGIWRKMQEKSIDLEQVHDVFAFRVIVPEERDCYLALGAIHIAFEPEPFRFKDYIAEPKANGYQSIHTSVRGRDGLPFEVQIRSATMHRLAENGTAAHWRYKAESMTTVPAASRLRSLVGRLGPRSKPRG